MPFLQCGKPLSKTDVATFHLKTFDFYCGELDTAADDQWWRILVSASPASEGIRTLCFRMGIVLCDPVRFPLPVLLHAAANPMADEVLPAVKLRELLRLGEGPCQPMQAHWRIVQDEVRFRPARWSQQNTSDLLWLQDELSEDLFDAYDQFAPGRLEQRIAALSAAIIARERTHV